jgi:hypothetical protein
MSPKADHRDPRMRDDPLAAHFAAGRAGEAPVPPRLVAAVLEDAAQVAAGRAAPEAAARMSAWGPLALAASVALGFWIGLSGPAALIDGPALVREADTLLAADRTDPVETLFDAAEDG